MSFTLGEQRELTRPLITKIKALSMALRDVSSGEFEEYGLCWCDKWMEEEGAHSPVCRFANEMANLEQ